MRPIKKDSTDQSVVIRIIDLTTGDPENAVEHDTAGIDLWYRREGAAKTSITEAALAALDSVHADGGIELIGDGYYRLDLPDAAVATGANGVMIGGTVTGMIVIGCYVTLVDYDPYDVVRMGMTALPNAAADGAGGLPISDAGGLDLDTKLAATNEVTAARMGALTDWINGGRLDNLLDAIPTTAMRGTDNAATAANLATVAGYIDTEIGTIITHLTDIKGAGWTNENLTTVDGLIDTLVSRLTAARVAVLTDWINGGRLDLLLDAIPTTAMRGTDGANTVVPDAAGTAPTAAEIKTAIEAAGSHLTLIKAVTDALTVAAAIKLALSAGTILTGTVSHDNTAATTTIFYCDDITEATADHFKGRIVIFTSGALQNQATDITAYALVSGEGKITVTDLTEAPADNVTFIIV